MTAVIIAPRVEDMGSTTEPVLTDWWFRVRPSRTVEGEDWVLDEWPPLRQVSLTPVNLDPLSFAYELEMFRGSDLKTPRLHEFRIVPDSATTLKWQLLEKTGGPGSAPTVLSELEARVAALEAANPSGPATNIDSVSGVTAYAKNLIKTADDAAEARGLLDAAPKGSRTGGAVGATDLGITGSTSGAKFLRDDWSWQATPAAGNPDWADITGKPSTFPPSAHSHAVASTDLTDTTAVGEALMTAADADAARTVIGALGGSDPIGAANVAVAGVLYAQGSGTPRPTARTDVMVLWKASSMPANMIPGDVWLNGPDS